jgi:hypothetical protein
LLIEDLKKEMMGPVGDDEGPAGLGTLPTLQYITGVVYPEIIKIKDVKGDEIDGQEAVQDEDEEAHTDVMLPRSMGLSMIIAADGLGHEGLSITVSGAIYEERDEVWIRRPISTDGLPIKIPSNLSKVSFGDEKSSGDLLLKDLPGSIGAALEGFDLIWETYKVRSGEDIEGKWYLSVFLVNNRSCTSGQKAKNALYQSYINVSSGENKAIVARAMSYAHNDEDMRSLSLLYRRRHEFGIGHVCSVNWDPLNDSDVLIGAPRGKAMKDGGSRTLLPNENVDVVRGRCSAIETTYFPERRVKALEFKITDSKNKDLSFGFYDLSDEDFLEGAVGRRRTNIDELRRLSTEYGQWIDRTFVDGKDACPEYMRDSFKRNQDACRRSLSRINEGIDLLAKDNDAYTAFCLMNRAIWLQYINRNKAKATEGPYVIDHKDHRGTWRPFQLGFILQSIPSIVDRKHPDRNAIDLLWVSTGAGKTEAYLGLVAFQMFHNRVKHLAGENDGVEVVMRYTLRLLTLQQFTRAARLIFACEYIRLNDGYDVLHDCKPFSLGLYVGQSMTPNKVRTGMTRDGLSNDYDLYEKLYKRDRWTYSDLEWCSSTAEYAIGSWESKGKLPMAQNPVQFLSCPWCGTPMKANDFQIVKINSSRSDFVTRCSNVRCTFHNSPMPIQTVDECIYDNPPSFLIGTVDKFAQLPFSEDMSSLFGWRNGKIVGMPPSLIIQDELHLINGPLGSMVGLYEATMELLSLRGTKISGAVTMDELARTETRVVYGERPKMIASTATIRNADAQCRQLYDRLAIKFPATGTDITDSFFVRDRFDVENEKAYVGILCAGIGMKTSLKRTTSGIMERMSTESKARSLDEYDPYWTIVSYFNTRRELGGAVTLFRDDIRNDVCTLRPSMMDESSIGELHGGTSSTELPSILKRMETPAEGGDPYDVICCTNMFSVGVDVDRLGLMVMNCQPTATTEYLQATGRVGRNGDGLVITLFNQARPRDQSHFEGYYDYHARIQMHVESMSVTPYSEGSLDRALHAQYVAMMRHMFNDGGMPSIRSNQDCKSFTQNHRIHPSSLMFMLFILQRARAISKSDSVRNNVLNGLTSFQEEWLRRIRDAEDVCRKKGKKFAYQYQERTHFLSDVPRLLETNPSSDWLDPRWLADQDYGFMPILTPNSLRNVEEEVDLVELWVKK